MHHSLFTVYNQMRTRRVINAVRRYSIENQKGATAIDFVQRYSAEHILIFNALLALDDIHCSV